MNIVARMWSPVMYPFKDQLWENQLLQDSFSQLVQIGRWWQNRSASGRTYRLGPRRLCTFPDHVMSCHVFSPQKVKLTVFACIINRGRTHQLRPQSAICCRWCTRTLSDGRTRFKRTPVWAVWGHSCCLLLPACCTVRGHLSRCMSAQCTATGEALRAVLIHYRNLFIVIKS